MGSKHFNQEQKMTILNSAAEIGVRQAAELACVHYTSVYDWRSQLKSLGKHQFLNYKPSYPGRGIKQITSKQEKAVLDTWHYNPGFGPGQVRNQLRRHAITISNRTVRSIRPMVTRLQRENQIKKTCHRRPHAFGSRLQSKRADSRPARYRGAFV
jgi:hypothetical protein